MSVAEIRFNFHLELKKGTSLATVSDKKDTLLIGSLEYGLRVGILVDSESE